MQVAVLVVAWIHGCMGLYFWLRLKPAFGRVAPWLLALAVLVPVLALLGFAQGGRAILALAQDPAWRAVALQPVHVGLPDQVARLAAIRDGMLTTYAGLVAAVIVARGARTLAEVKRGTIRLSYPDGRVVRVPRGTSVLEASRRNRIPHASVCGGRGRCSTCRIRVTDGSDGAPTPGRAERAVLERIAAGPGVRLACQFRPETDLAVVPLLPPQPRVRQADLLDRAQSGEERFIVAMFVDLRGSTRLAEERLPYDTVFIINRFLSAVGDAVREAGGSTNQFLGDGLLALFGLETEPEQAARDALRAVDLIAESVDTLNRLLAADLEHTLRYGIGVHAGSRDRRRDGRRHRCPLHGARRHRQRRRPPAGADQDPRLRRRGVGGGLSGGPRGAGADPGRRGGRAVRDRPGQHAGQPLRLPSLRAQRSNPGRRRPCRRPAALGRFAALAMTGDPQGDRMTRPPQARCRADRRRGARTSISGTTASAVAAAATAAQRGPAASPSRP